MTKVALSSTNASPVITKGGQSVTGTGGFAVPDWTGDEIAFRRAAAETATCVGASVTVEQSPRFPVYAWTPRRFRQYGVVTGVSGNTLTVDFEQRSRGGLSVFDRYGKDCYVGGALTAWRMSSGAMSQVATGRAIGGVTFKVQEGAGTYDVYTGTTIDIRTSYYYEIGASIWVRVAAVSGGAIGAFTAWAEYVIPTNLQDTLGGTATSSTDTALTEGAAAAPTGLTVTQHPTYTDMMRVAFTSGATDHVVQVSFIDPADLTVNAETVVLDDASGLAVGDLVFTEKLITTFAGNALARIYGASESKTLVPFGCLPGDMRLWAQVQQFGAGAKPDASVGDWYLEVTVPDGEQFYLEDYWACGEYNDFYVHPGTMTAECSFWVEADAALTLSCTTGEPGEVSQNVSVTTSWAAQSFEHTWTGTPQNTATPRALSMTWTNATGGPVAIRLCHFRFHDKNDPLDHAFYTAAATGVHRYRDHTSCKPGTLHYGIVEMQDADDYASYHRHLDLCEAAGVDPWVQITWLAPKADWLVFAADIATQAARFDRIILELGNERTFNSRPEFVPVLGLDGWGAAETAAKIDAMLYSWMREVPAFVAIEDKIVKHFGSWAKGVSHTEAAKYTGDVHEVSEASYIGDGFDTTGGVTRETIGAFRLLLSTSAVLATNENRWAAHRASAEVVTATVGHPVKFISYESGPAYLFEKLSAADKVAQEPPGKSRAAATGMLDQFCRWAENGGAVNLFKGGRIGDTFESYNREGVEFPWHRFATEVVRQLGECRVYPTYQARGTTEAALIPPSTSGTKRRVAVTLFQSVATPGKWIIAARNLQVDQSVFDVSDPDYTDGDDGRLQVVVNTGLSSATGISYFNGGIGNMREHNRWKPGFREDPATGAVTVVDPLCVAFDYSWTAATLPASVGRIDLADVIGENLRGGNTALILIEGAA